LATISPDAHAHHQDSIEVLASEIATDMALARYLTALAVAGAFSTAPIDPLHQLMGTMPIDLDLQLLIKNVFLRLYKIPISSQLAARVPGPWGPRIRGLIPLPIQPRQRPYRSSLLSLADSENLPNTPYIDLLAAPSWNLDFSHPWSIANRRVRHSDEQKLWANVIEDLTSKSDHLTIFAQGSKANHNRDDEQQPAICITAAFSNQAEKDHTTQLLGTTHLSLNSVVVIIM
jgi:hypothetical protein